MSQPDPPADKSDVAIAIAVADADFTTYSSIACARNCGATLAAETVNGTDTLPIVAERAGWMPLTSGWYCPCCRSPWCTH